MNLFKPYIRGASSLHTDLSGLATFYDLKQVRQDVKFSIDEDISEDLWNLSKETISETISIEMSSLKATKAEYEAIRTAYDNKLVDMVLLGQPGISVSIYSAKAKVKLVAETNKAAYFTISATLRIATETFASHVALFTEDQSAVALPSSADSIVGVIWDSNTDSYSRSGSVSHISDDAIPEVLMPIQSNMKRCVLKADGSVDYYLHPYNSNYKEDGISPSKLDGTDGNIMVEIPEHWYLQLEENGVYQYSVSNVSRPGFTHSPKRYVGAYAAYVKSTKLESRSGVLPTTSINIADFRTKAEAVGTGWHLFDHESWKVVAMLYLTEYASFNSQVEIGAGNTAFSGFVKNSNGLSDFLGNQTGNKTTAGGSSDDFMSYRGIENLYGNVWQFLDGCAVRDDGVSSKLYLCTDPSQYHSYAENNTEAVAAGYNLLGNLAESDNYGKVPLVGSFLPVSVQSSSSDFMCDMYYTNYDSDASCGWRVVLVGGYSAYGSRAGVFFGTSLSSFSIVASSIGARLCFLKV